MALHHHHRQRRLATGTAFTLLLFFSTSAAPILSHLGDDNSVGLEKEETKLIGSNRPVERIEGIDYEKRVIGPGSSPPSCRSKCGQCVPCKPVHVPIHPGLTVPLEYYPEAWRCKCGNKLFMP